MEIYTQNGLRPDLNGKVVTLPNNTRHIGHFLMPVLNVLDQSGNIYVAQRVTATAQTDRNPTEAPDATTVASKKISYATGEIIARGIVTEREVKALGGIESADLQGAALAAEAVRNKIEGEIAESVIGEAAATFPDSANATVQAVMAAAAAKKGYRGRKAIVGSETAIRKLLENVQVSAFHGLFQRYAFLATDPQVTDGLKIEKEEIALAKMFGADYVIHGDDELWEQPLTVAVGIFDGFDGLSANPISYKLGPVFGRMVVYLPDPSTPEFPYAIQSMADLDKHLNAYDATAMGVAKTFNTGAVTLVGLCEEPEAAPEGGGGEG